MDFLLLEIGENGDYLFLIIIIIYYDFTLKYFH